MVRNESETRVKVGATECYWTERTSNNCTVLKTRRQGSRRVRSPKYFVCFSCNKLAVKVFGCSVQEWSGRVLWISGHWLARRTPWIDSVRNGAAMSQGGSRRPYSRGGPRWHPRYKDYWDYEQNYRESDLNYSSVELRMDQIRYHTCKEIPNKNAQSERLRQKTTPPLIPA
ncbi:unnamed protein product [Plutella xylostella]|uniref:(diamondback moth) hypothetical protein n=1 Tax=Plutella xylostella TaxID=51655 RepID=A0A8S4G4P9_PLUXY|nr:unnamed protein product [Plutella xylostella]